MTERQNAFKLEPGTLWRRLMAQTEHALDCGAVHPLSTTQEIVAQNGVGFVVRVLSSLERKELSGKKRRDNVGGATQKTEGRFNPFLPYDNDLFVADLSATHVALLNKFNVVAHHLLIVTRAFEEQESPLNFEDFQALAACMTQVQGLAFYNAGAIAGASQRHKHLQLVPLPLVAAGPRIPIEPALALTPTAGPLHRSRRLSFEHAIARLDWPRAHTLQEKAALMLERYQSLLAALGIGGGARGFAHRPSYNLLITREWMFMVPRSRESFQGISVNALGFAGTLLVRNSPQLSIIKSEGPMKVLRSVAFTAPTTTHR